MERKTLQSKLEELCRMGSLVAQHLEMGNNVLAYKQMTALLEELRQLRGMEKYFPGLLADVLTAERS